MSARREYKLIFTGSVGAGKTTAISVISEIRPISTDVENTDRAESAKATTTTALDYGEVTLAGGDKLRLYGTPGQQRFDFMWKIVGTGALGVVILIDNARADPLDDLRTYLAAFADMVRDGRAVVGVGRTDSHPLPRLEEFHGIAQSLDLSLPIFSVDVRRRADVLLLLDALFRQIEAAESAELVAEEGHA